MTYRITNKVKLPKGVKTLPKRKQVKNVYESTNEEFPLTKMDVLDSVFIAGRTARSLRGTIHKFPRNRGMHFVSRTTATGARVWRVG